MRDQERQQRDVWPDEMSDPPVNHLMVPLLCLHESQKWSLSEVSFYSPFLNKREKTIKLHERPESFNPRAAFLGSSCILKVISCK